MQASDLHRVLRGVPSDCVDLLDKMLTFLPEDRLAIAWMKHYNTPTSRASPKANLESGRPRPASRTVGDGGGPGHVAHRGR